MAYDHEYPTNLVTIIQDHDDTIRNIEIENLGENVEGDELLIELVQSYPHIWNKNIVITKTVKW